TVAGLGPVGEEASGSLGDLALERWTLEPELSLERGASVRRRWVIAEPLARRRPGQDRLVDALEFEAEARERSVVDRRRHPPHAASPQVGGGELPGRERGE